MPQVDSDLLTNFKSLGIEKCPYEIPNKKLSNRKETVRLLHNIEIMILH